MNMASRKIMFWGSRAILASNGSGTGPTQFVRIIEELLERKVAVSV
jgi:hypothetical protein